MTRISKKRLFFLLALWLCTPVLLAQNDPESSAADQQSAEEQAQAMALARELEQRYGGIESLRETVGIYHPSLAEAYVDLAIFLRENGRYEEAADVNDQALQITRINSGLYSEDQLPIIQALLANHGALRDWDEVDKYQELNLHMHRRLFALDDDRYLDSLDQFGRWKLRLLRENLLDQSYRGLSSTAEDLSITYGTTLATLDASGQGTPRQLFNLVAGKSEADIILAREIARTPYTAFQGTVSPYITQQRCQRVRNSQGQLETQCVRVRVENPQYRASQRTAKSYALSRYTRVINNSIERLMDLREQNPDLSAAELEEIDSQIASLQLESQQLRRTSRRESLF